MPPYESEWRIQDDDEEVELEDQGYASQRDAVLFCINISPSILEVREAPTGDTSAKDTGRSALEVIFQAAVDLQKRKIVHGPADSVGVLLFNSAETQGDIVKPNMYLYQPVAQINAPDIQKLLQLLNEAGDNRELFSTLFTPSAKRVTMANVFQTCIHVLRDGASKIACKRIFLFTDDDDPELGDTLKAKATQKIVEDMYDLGIVVKPFFMASPGQPFNVHNFYGPVLARGGDDVNDDVTLNVHESFEAVLADMRIHEANKRALFNVPLQFGDGFSIAVKGFGLVMEQKKGTYRYYANMGRSIEEATARTTYVDEEQETEIPKESIVFGYQFGSSKPEVPGQDEDAMEEDASSPHVKDKVFYTPEQMKLFRTFDLAPSIKILGFKDMNTLPFDANIKRSVFLHPNEADRWLNGVPKLVTGSIRTFKALLDSMVSKKKYALARCIFRKNSAMVFCAMLPQAEVMEDNLQVDPAGFYLIPLPFADDIRQPTVDQSAHCSSELRKAAVDIIERLKYSAGYDPEAIPNPSLALHYGFLQAEAFGEEYNPEEDFNDRSAPRFRAIHKKAGTYMEAWKEALDQDPEAAELAPEPKPGTKRKALTVEQLKTYLKAHNQPYSGRKNDLVERVQDWFIVNGRDHVTVFELLPATIPRICNNSANGGNLTMSLWVDKASSWTSAVYRPRTLDDLNYHQDLSARLRSLAGSGDFPHMLFYGPSGAGKKTRIACTLRELYGPSVEKLKIDQRVFLTPSKRKLDVNVVQSNCHIEITPRFALNIYVSVSSSDPKSLVYSDVGMYDRVVISEILKEIAQTQQVDLNAKQRFKGSPSPHFFSPPSHFIDSPEVVVINEADSLSRDAQAALRRTMERYMSNLRIIMCANGTSKLIAPIKSRCLLVRVAAPNEQDMDAALRKVAKKEKFELPDEAAAKIISDAGGNLRKALLVLEAMKMQSPDLTSATPIAKPDWESYCYKVADMIMQEQSPQRVMDVRAKLYELLTHCIPPTVIMKTIAERLLEVVDDSIKPDIMHWAAIYELRMRQGSKKIYHLEAWVIKVMSLYKHFFHGIDMEDFE
ncbi:Replication factor C (RF-C) subunit [Ceratobasidium sp. 414]|nr:Replication factor C (RF-C) subunit [Ceratobasidium sp. 414]